MKAELKMIINVMMLLASIVLLWVGAKYLVDSSCRIAFSLGISELVIGLTVVAFGTSAPELAVTINAIAKGLPDVSIGNIIGSSIFNVGFILGITAFLRSIKTSPAMVYRDGIFTIIITVIIGLFLADHFFSRHEGVILMVIFIAYLLFLFIKKEKTVDDDIPHEPARLRDYIILPASIAVVVVGGKFLVASSCAIARAAGLSEWAIGATIVAAGTSAPEFVTSIVAGLKKRYGISVGNVIGSNIFNMMGILGFAGMLSPMQVSGRVMTSLVVFLFMMLITVMFIRTSWKLSRLEGAALLAIGIASWVWEIIVSG